MFSELASPQVTDRDIIYYEHRTHRKREPKINTKIIFKIARKATNSKRINYCIYSPDGAQFPTRADEKVLISELSKSN